MPIINKYDPNNWYNSIPRNDQPKHNPLLDPDFDVSQMEENEIEQGNGLILAKIPQIEGRIRQQDDEENDITQIIFLADSWLDGEGNHTEEVPIGEAVFGKFKGLMVANEHYHEYFDTKGQLYNDPLQRRKEREGREAGERPTDKVPDEQDSEEPTVDEIRAALLETGKRLQEKEVKLQRKEKQLNELLQQTKEDLQKLRILQEEQKEMKEARRVSMQEKEKAHIRLLNNILGSYINTVKDMAKRKPDILMRETQIRTINEVLTELKGFFTGSEAEDYLHLAQEPREDDLEHYPGTTYGEMAILLSAYEWTISAFQKDYLYAKDLEIGIDEDDGECRL